MDFSYLDEWIQEEVGAEPLSEVGEGYRNIWVVAEVAGASLLPATLETMGQARDLADQVGVHVYGVLLGEGVLDLADELVAYGADKVLVADERAFSCYQPETYVNVLAGLVHQYRPEIVLCPATPLGNDFAPRLAQRLATGLISNCLMLDLDMSERLLLGTFPILGGEMHHTFSCPDARPQMATLRPGHFPVPIRDSGRSGEVRRVDMVGSDATDRLLWINLDAATCLPEPPLSRARVVVSAGRGMRDQEGFALVQELATALGGVVAGSRGAFDKGWICEEQIVGVGGNTIAPQLYVACGVSGDVFHHFGLQDAKYVVAINTDEQAPIATAANMALVGDARQLIPAILEALAQ